MDKAKLKILSNVDQRWEELIRLFDRINPNEFNQFIEDLHKLRDGKFDEVEPMRDERMKYLAQLGIVAFAESYLRWCQRKEKTNE